MRITWKDGVTTLATAGVIVLERAYFHNWDWPLVSSMRWVMFGIAALIAISYVFSYVLDSTRSTIWTWTSAILVIAAGILTALGMIFVASDYVVLLMLTAVVFWAASIVAHLTVHSTSTHRQTFA